MRSDSMDEDFINIMIFNYDPNQLADAAEDVPPIGLSVPQLIYLEAAMISSIAVPYMTLHIFLSATLALLAYLIVNLLLLPYLYVYCLAQGKRPLDYYLTENNFALALSSVIIFISTFTMATFFLSQENINSIKELFDQTKSFEQALFGCLFIFGLGMLEEYFWRNFLIKSLPNGCLSATYTGVHYAILCMFVLSSTFEWQYSILIGLLGFIWHLGMVYARKLYKFSTVAVYGITGRLGIYMSFYILFSNFQWH